MNSMYYIVAAGIALAEKYEGQIAQLTRERDEWKDQANRTSQMKAFTDDLSNLADSVERLRAEARAKGISA